MIIIPFKVLGKDWKLRLLKKKKYVKKNGDDSLAVTLSWKRRIDLSPRGQTRETLLHELWHAYLTEICVKSATEMPNSDFEEVTADLFSVRGEEIISLGDELMAEMNRVLQPRVDTAQFRRKRA